MMAVGTQTTCFGGTCGGVTFSFKNGTAEPIFPMWQRYLPNENWAVAAAFQGLGYRTDIVNAVYSSIQSLETSVGWRPAFNRESQWGIIIPYTKSNTNIGFVMSNGRYLVMPGTTTPYQITGATPWNTASQSWIFPGDMNVAHATNNSCNGFNETGYQALNLALRGDHTDAVANVQWMADQAIKNSDGSVGFCTAPYRGMFLGVFIECVEVIGIPSLPNGITMDDVINTLWGLQPTQSDGGIPRQYSSFTSGVLGSDDETTNGALDAFSPGLVNYVRSVAASGQFNLQSQPNPAPTLTGITTSTTSSTTSTTSSSTTSSSTSTTTSTTSTTTSHTTSSSTTSTSSSSQTSTSTSTSTTSPTSTTSSTTSTTVTSSTSTTPTSQTSTTSSSSTTTPTSTTTTATSTTSSTSSIPPVPTSTSTTSTTTTSTLTSFTTTQPSFDFSIGGSASGTVVPGGNVSFAVSVSALSGVPLPVLLSVEGVPPGATVGLSTTSGTPDFSVGVAVATSISTPPGLYFIDVFGTSGSTSRVYVYPLLVNSTTTKSSSYVLDLSSRTASAGITSPPSGSYVIGANQNVTVNALPARGFTLSHWVVNGKNLGNGTSLSFTMTKDTVLDAVFIQTNPQGPAAETVSIESRGLGNITVDHAIYSLPVTFNWAVGSRHNISAPTLIQSSSDTRERFAGWSGSLNSSSPILNLKVIANMNILVNYEPQHLVAFQFAGPDGTRIVPSFIVIRGPNGLLQVKGNSSAWLDSGKSYALVWADWMGQNVAVGNPAFTVGTIGRITIPVSLVNQVVRVVDIFGIPIGDAAVTLILANDSQLTQTTNGAGQIEFDRVPPGTHSVRVSYLGVSNTLSDVTLGNSPLDVTVVLSYPLLIVIPVIVLFGALLRLRQIRRRNQAKRHYDNLVAI